MAQRQLTIVQMVPELNCGGVEQVTVELASEIARLGHRSIVLSAGGQLAEELQRSGVEHFTWPIRAKSPWTLRVIWPLRKFLQKASVDIVHAHSRIPAWVADLTLRTLPSRSRPSFITTAHGLYRPNLFSRVMTRGERVIAISETVQKYLEDSYKDLPPNRVRTIPLGIDTEQFSRDFLPSPDWLKKWQRTYPQLNGCPVITLIGRMVRLKGHADLIEIVEQVRETVPNIKALIVGGEDPRRRQYARQIHEEVRERRLEQHVIFTGQRNDIREIYSISDVVVGLTSNPPEAFGRTTIEALSMGVPVVGYAHGGTGEILERVFPEGLVRVGDWTTAARMISKFIQFPPVVPTEHFYLKSHMLAETVSLYEELAA